MESRLEKLEIDNLWENLFRVLRRLKEIGEIDDWDTDFPTITIRTKTKTNKIGNNGLPPKSCTKC